MKKYEKEHWFFKHGFTFFFFSAYCFLSNNLICLLIQTTLVKFVFFFLSSLIWLKKFSIWSSQNLNVRSVLLKICVYFSCNFQILFILWKRKDFVKEILVFFLDKLFYEISIIYDEKWTFSTDPRMNKISFSMFLIILSCMGS